MNFQHLERHLERRLTLGPYALLILVQALCAGTWNAHAEGLLRPAASPPSAEQRIQLEADPYVMRWRMAHMESDALFRAGPSSDPLVLDLFGDVSLKAQVRSAKTLETRSSFLFGTVEGGGHFTLLRTSSGIVRGEFDSARGFYKLRSERGGPNRVLIRQQDRSKLPGCGFDAQAGAKTIASHEPIAPLGVRKRYLHNRSNTPPPDIQAPSDPHSNPIDILVLYDQGAEDHEGGLKELQATVEYYFLYANNVLTNSGLPHRRFRLAALEKVGSAVQDEDGIVVNLNIQNEDGTAVDPYSGVPPSVFSLLDKHGAEQVHVLVVDPINLGTKEDPSLACGVASIGPIHGNSEYYLRLDCRGSENYALCLRNGRRERLRRLQVFQTGRHGWRARQTTTALRCSGAITFIHELGHSLTVRHHRTTAISLNRARSIYDVLPRGAHHYLRESPVDGIFVTAMGESLPGGDENDYWPWSYAHIHPFGEGSTCGITMATITYGQPPRVQLTGGCARRRPSTAYLWPSFSNPELSFPPPPQLDFWKPGVAMGVVGDRETFDASGPVNATKAVDRVWDAVAHRFDPPLDKLPDTCNEGDVPANLLQDHLAGSAAFASAGETKSFAVSLSAPSECADGVKLKVRSLGAKTGPRLYEPRQLVAWPSAGAFEVAVAETAGRFAISANRDHYGACSATRRAFAVVELANEAMVDAAAVMSMEKIVQKVPGTRRHGMLLQQGAAHSFCRGAPPRQLRRLGDFDGNGKADVLLRHADGRWLYNSMDGADVLSEDAAALAAKPAVSAAGVGDFDGDGKDDLLVRRPNGGWRYYRMDGRRSLAGGGGVALPSGRAWQVEGIGDFNGDGKDDVLMKRVHGEWHIWPHYAQYEDSWRYYAMDGRTVLGEGSPADLSTESPTATWVAGVGDFNGDGRDDALLRRIDGTWHYFPFYGRADGEVGVFSGHGPVALTDDLAWTVAGVADFNGDGKDDLLLRHEDGRWRYQPMNGGELLEEGAGRPDLPADPEVWLAGEGDMNGDGRADVLTRRGHGAWHYWPARQHSETETPFGRWVGRWVHDDFGPSPNRGEVGLAGEPGWGVLTGGVVGAPRADAPMDDQLLATGEDATLDLSMYFSADQTLTYEAASNDADVVRVQVTGGGQLMLTPVANGRATVTVTARDADGNVARQTFQAIASANGQVGRRFRDCPQCPEMVVVPAGSFMMGSPAEEEGGPQSYQLHERPQHRVDFAAPFAIGLFEVTFEQWDACLAGGGCGGYRPEAPLFDEPNHPIVDVSWNDAQAYVEWLSARTGQHYRLPSEAEWEYAARAGTTTPFHFGETIRTDQANYDGEVPSPRRYEGEEESSYAHANPGFYRHGPVPVGSLPANLWGLHEVHGNVAEWTQDCFSDVVGYAGWPADGSALESGDCESRHLRNGSYYDDPGDVRSARRSVWRSDFRHGFSGLRVARTLEE